MLRGIDLVNFTSLDIKEKDMIILWRNNPKIKKWMFTSDDISTNNHLDFIQNLNNQKNKLYFLVKEHNNYIGIISFINTMSDIIKVGIYSNPSLKGVGAILMQTIVEYAFKTLKAKKLIAEVFSQNIKAFNLYKRYDFLEVDRKKFNDKELICMELKKNIYSKRKFI